MPKMSFSGLKWYSPPAFLGFLNLRFLSLASWTVIDFCALELDAEESVVSVESDESTRCDWARLGKSFARPPTDLGEGVGVLSPPAVGVTGVRPSAGSSSSSSSSSDEKDSWRTGPPALERTVPMPSV